MLNYKIKLIKGNNYLPYLKRMLHNDNILIIKGQNNKPYLRTKQYFSISHSHNYTVIVTSNHEIGVDMEYIRRYDSSLLSYLNIPPMTNQQFFKYYTQKEAYLKRHALSLKDILRPTNLSHHFHIFKKRGFIITICF